MTYWKEMAIADLFRRYSLPAWLFCWVAILIAGLWPFSSHRRNQVDWLQAENGLRFGPNGVVVGKQSIAGLLGGATPKPGFTMEILLRPQAQKRKTLQSIVADDGASRDPRFALEQWGQVLLLRTFFGGAAHSAYRKVGIDGALAPGLVHVAVATDNSGTTIYVNGMRKATQREPIAVERLTGKVLLGNSGLLTTPWRGDVLTFGIYPGARNAADIAGDANAWRARKPDANGAISLFQFKEKTGEFAHDGVYPANSFLVARDLRILHRTLLEWDFKESISGFEDVVVNIVGFIPFGAFGVVVVARRKSTTLRVGIVLMVGLVCSLCIEATQAYIPLRASSSVDVLMNTLGTAIGAVSIAIFTNSHRHPSPPGQL